MRDSIEGAAREMGGRVQQKVGDLTGDAKSQVSGLYSQAAGQAQQQAARLSDVIRDQPLTAAILAIGVGYLIGRFTS